LQAMVQMSAFDGYAEHSSDFEAELFDGVAH
jgi:hypothetical protein